MLCTINSSYFQICIYENIKEEVLFSLDASNPFSFSFAKKFQTTTAKKNYYLSKTLFNLPLVHVFFASFLDTAKFNYFESTNQWGIVELINPPINVRHL